MASNKHHLSFLDHLSLYLPHPLRPPLPRDLRPRSASVSVPPTPAPTPERNGSRERPPHATMEPGRTTTKSESDKQPESRQQTAMIQEALSKGKSREGYHVSLILTNSGSVARDHLASERTFLAYVRTSLALASTGVALVQLLTIAENSQNNSAQRLLLRHFSAPLGSTLIVTGFIVLLLGCLRYFAIQTALTRGVFPAARITVVFVVVTLSAITGIVFGVLLRSRSVT